ncbi:F0F1 ATP synthase subunit gamma [Immundisolibacter sp.]|uniref:F0F1 ATP synthase subunit gamma n=1 Tax=Immundisolibacter sp. TaxID=1934948 RepID=UPI002B15116A|nr:F0F1 ATP synthase subunit gamma [Immundisolibacter sp.]MEA3219941.1 ATP synthase gamma chain [Immundisolibacter sp.]
MSRYRELTEHLKGLEDMRAILAGMRTLAAVELQRVTRLQDASEQLRQGLEAAVAAHFAGRPPPPATADVGVCVLLGSEKGLCGDFNERLLAAAAGDAQPRVLVGSKLAATAVRMPAVAARCPGALAADDVGPVLTGLAQTLAGLNAAGGRLDVLCHEPQQHRVRRVAVLPPPTGGTASDATPRLQLPAPQFAAALLEQYLFAVLNGLLIGSLLVENQQRIAHLQAALQRLDDRCDELRQRQRHARQEQIIEEVEVALSVAGAGH